MSAKSDTQPPRPQLSAAKQKLLEERLRGLASPAAPQPQIPRRPTGATPPLSFAQQRLWFIHCLEPGSPAYNMPEGMRLRGPLNIGALDEALTELVRRHEALRTTFPSEDGQAIQKISEATPVKLFVTSLEYLPPAEREAQAAALHNAEARRPFDLAAGPLFRTLLLRLAPEDHVLVLNMHHIVSDGWSLGILQKELSELYRRSCDGDAAKLPEPTLQYADFAHWQRDWLQGEPLNKQLGYWKQKLAEAPAMLELPTDHPRPGKPSLRGVIETLALPKPLMDGLRALSQGAQCTLFMTLLATFEVLLHRFSAQEDFCIGSAVAGRNRRETEGIVGFFVNTLVLRADCAGSPTFSELLQRVRKTALEAYEHQDMPFEKLVEELHPERSLAHTPLFQVFFNLMNFGTEKESWRDLNVESYWPSEGLSKFDLTVYVEERPTELVLKLVCNADLFTAETMRRWLQQWQQLIEGILANPNRRIGEYSLLNSRERDRLLVEWNETRSPFAQDGCVHQLFEEQVQRTPDALALVYEEQRLTFREVNDRANQVARSLRNLGVGPDSLVALAVERSADMIIGLLGILKAGAAYAALDPMLPPVRLAGMLEDSTPVAMVTQERVLKALPTAPKNVICLDRDAEQLRQLPKENLECNVTGRNLAYVIFTSGSTGRPKGVAIEHRQLLNYLMGIRSRLDLPADASYATVSTIAADLGNTTVFPPLCFGGCLHVISRDRASEPAAFADYLRRQRIDCLKIVPSHLGALLGAGSSDVLPRQRLIFGGEPLPWKLVEQVRTLSPECVVFNHYGPTETTVGVLTNRLEVTEARQGGEIVPLGRPIPNVRIYILDANREPVPVGVPGEIYIGGDCVARGYLNAPDVNAAKFVADPFLNGNGSRLYRTGDLGRYLSDGKIDFIGRIDQQVKIRGFRIELGEIQAVLRRQRGVRDAVVVVREITPGDKRLVAYFVGVEGEVPTTPELRQFLQAELPDYMVPSGFVAMEKLPLTANGKLDYRALPTSLGLEAETARSFVTPRTPVEEVIAATWAEVLRVEKVGVHDNFFALGGHSLLTIQIMDRLSKAGLGLTLAQILQHQTVAELASVASTKQTVESAQDDWSSLVTLQPRGTKPPLYLVHTVPGDVLGYVKLVYYLGNDQPVYGFQSLGLLRKEASHRTIEEMAAHYVKLLRQFQPKGPYYLGGWCFGGNVAMEMAQQLADQGQTPADVVLMESSAHNPPKTYLPYAAHRMRCLLRAGPKMVMELWRTKLRRLYDRFDLEADAREFAFDAATTGPLTNRSFVYPINLAATRRYQSRPRVYPGKVTLLRRTHYDAADAIEPDCGFATLVKDLEIRYVPGDHRSVLKEPHVRKLAEEIKVTLERKPSSA